MIDKSKRSAVILAAGKGTRYINSLPDNVNVSNEVSKCTVQFPLNKKGSYLTPLTATINACLASGIFDFHVVVSYGKSSVIAECDRIIRIYGKDRINITYVEVEPDYNRNLSIRRGLYSAAESGAQEIYLMNGDTLIAPKFIERLVDVPNAAMLVRTKEFLETPMEFSVGSLNGVTTSIHKNIAEEPYYCCEVFKIPYEDANKITPEYDGNDEDYGLLNGIIEDSHYNYHRVFVHPTDGIYDLNTYDDYNKIKHMLQVIQ